MIARKEWFAIGHHGFRPAQWEGWVYLSIALLLLIGVLNLPFLGVTRFFIALALILLVMLDLLQVIWSLDATITKAQRSMLLSADSSTLWSLTCVILLVFIYRLIVLDRFDYSLLGVLIFIPFLRSLLVRAFQK